MKWIGLTGGIATGKSSVSNILRDLGRPVVDADVLSHEVIRKNSPGYDQVLQNFGPEILAEDGEIDRKKLGPLVFGNPAKLQVLEAIIHPLVQEAHRKARTELEDQGHDMAFYDVPLLFEKELQDNFDCTVLVYCSEQEQKKRLIERDQLTNSDAELRLKAQIPIDKKREMADHILLNEGTLADLKNQVLDLVNKL